MPRKPSHRTTKALLEYASAGAVLENIDTTFIPDSHYDGVLVGPRPARVIAEDAAREFTALFNAGVDCFNLSRKHRAVLRAIIGKGGMPARMLLSCVSTRLRLTAELTKQWRSHWHQHRRERGRQYIFATIITDTGNALARRPEIDLETLRRRIDKLLRDANLQGNFVIEVQLITNFPRQGHGGTHCWHDRYRLHAFFAEDIFGRVRCRCGRNRRIGHYVCAIRFVHNTNSARKTFVRQS